MTIFMYISLASYVLDVSCPFCPFSPRHHHGVVTGVTFTPNGLTMFSSSSTGSLAMYDSSQRMYPTTKILGTYMHMLV